MAKVPFSDVVPPDKRSIRNIQISRVSKKKSPVIIKPEEDLNTKVQVESPVVAKISDLEMNNARKGPAYEYYYPKNQNSGLSQGGVPTDRGRDNKKRLLFTGAIIFVAGIFLVSMMTVFSSASILITPKTQDISVAVDIVVAKEGGEGFVGYEVVKLSRKEVLPVQAKGEESVEVKSRGKIVIYNDFSSDPQRLIARTRFESPDGLIYRIPESVVVPGKIVKNGVSTPGSIEVEVFADEPGEKYNIKKTDFTVPGFKNDPERYKQFFARSSTDMSGGFVGKRKTVLPEAREEALANTESEAKIKLEREISSKIPKGLTLLKEAIVYDSSELPQTEDSSGVLIGKEVTAYAILLNSQNLSNKISSEYSDQISGWVNTGSFINDFSSLSITNSIDKSALETNGKIAVNIKGEAKLIADIDLEDIKNRLIGANKKEAANIVDEFGGISSIKVTLRPIWKRSFPGDASKITIQTQLE